MPDTLQRIADDDPRWLPAMRAANGRCAWSLPGCDRLGNRVLLADDERVEVTCCSCSYSEARRLRIYLDGSIAPRPSSRPRSASRMPGTVRLG